SFGEKVGEGDEAKPLQGGDGEGLGDGCPAPKAKVAVKRPQFGVGPLIQGRADCRGRLEAAAHCWRFGADSLGDIAPRYAFIPSPAEDRLPSSPGRAAPCCGSERGYRSSYIRFLQERRQGWQGDEG